MPINYFGIDLLDLKLIQEDSKPSFILSGDSGKTSILINYNPILDPEYSFKDFEIHLFENCYLNAENDVFQIYESGIKDRIGWMFSLSNLESKESDEYENIHLNRYKFVAFQLLLLAYNQSISIKDTREEFNLSDFYPNNPIVVILSKNKLSKIDLFKIENYYPSLSKYGYYIQSKSSLSKKITSKEIFCLQLRNSKKINLFKSKFDISKTSFFYELFTNSLKTFEHHLIRFHLLYQIIEYLLNKRFEDSFVMLIDQFNNKGIKKNDFIENINNAKKERINIRLIIENLKTSKCIDFNETDMKRDCKLLLEQHSDEVKDNLGDLIYDIRNLIMHNYREIKTEQLTTLDFIIHQLELLVINLIEDHSPGTSS